jgi:hypothetical protein
MLIYAAHHKATMMSIDWVNTDSLLQSSSSDASMIASFINNFLSFPSQVIHDCFILKRFLCMSQRGGKSLERLLRLSQELCRDMKPAA